MQDSTLLTQYARDGSEIAFGQLLARHLPLVYRTCRRELGSDTLAEDAAQVVFLLLARKARMLRAGPSLAGWLYQTSMFVAKDVRKQEARRQRREESVMQETLRNPASPASEWDAVEPLLNSALCTLKPTDRDAVLLRYLEGHTLSETGVLLGMTEDAARMRCAHALEKLRSHLTTHGPAVTGVALAALLPAEAARPVSAEAVTAITRATLKALASGPAPNVLLLSKGVSHTMKIIKVKYAALAAGLLLAAGSIPFAIYASPLHSAKTTIIRQARPAAVTAKAASALDYWQYPQGSGYGAQLAVVSSSIYPSCLQGTTHDPIEKAYAFYRAKATNGLGVEHGFNWQKDLEITLLVNQPITGGKPDGGIGFTALAEAHRDADYASMIIHQPTQTVFVKLSRDAQNRSWTNIAVVIDKH